MNVSPAGQVLGLRVMILVLSAGALGSRWLSFELGAAVADNKRIMFPVSRVSTWRKF